MIVADTPTGDGTGELCGAEARLLYLPVGERGYGAAVLAGLAVARAENVVICDADHDLGPAQVATLLGPLADPEVGLVTAARTDTSGLSLPQRFGNGLATMLIALGWGRRFADLLVAHHDLQLGPSVVQVEKSGLAVLADGQSEDTMLGAIDDRRWGG